MGKSNWVYLELLQLKQHTRKIKNMKILKSKVLLFQEIQQKVIEKSCSEFKKK